jgi:hypothetical protein
MSHPPRRNGTGLAFAREVSLLTLLALACLSGCSPPAATPAVKAEVGGARAAEQLEVRPWPQASARFRSRGPWLGADSAYSVDLGSGRVLWLFGDTFIDPARDGSRVNGPNLFLRNSAALQTPAQDTTLYELSRSQLTFFTGPERDGAPSSFFPETEQGDWFWPLHGALVPDGKLLVFRMQIRKVSSGFGFAVVGWDAVAVDTPHGMPNDWAPRVIGGQSSPAAHLVGSSVLIEGEYLYAYAAKNDDRDHTIFLARFALASLRGLPSGALADPEWYTARGYQRQSAGAVPEPVLPEGQIEFSVHFERRLERFVQFQTRGLFASDPQTAIVMRTAQRPEGPWSLPSVVYVPPAPPGTDPSKLLTYAAKAHPEQRGADAVLTYMQNDVANPAPNDAVYYPEVLRLTF